MPTETRGQKRKKLEEEEAEGRKREAMDRGVKWIEDFPLEVIEKIAKHLGPKDVFELMMVNKRLYSGYARDQSIVFGDHVYEITGHFISKHPCPQKFKLDFDRHLHLIRRVITCDKLELQTIESTESGPINQVHETILTQLRSVNCLVWHVFSTDLTNSLTHFHASVNEYAYLEIDLDSFQEDQLFSDLLGNFIEKQLADCERIHLRCEFDELFHVCYQALKKTRIKMIDVSMDNFFLAIQWIVKHGIPSKKPEASYCASIYNLDEETRETVDMDEIISFLREYPGMEEIVGENRILLLEHAKNLWKRERFLVEDSDMEEVFCFRQKIELTKDCIYIIRCGRHDAEFDLFYAFHIFSPTLMK